MNIPDNTWRNHFLLLSLGRSPDHGTFLQRPIILLDKARINILEFGFSDIRQNIMLDHRKIFAVGGERPTVLAFNYPFSTFFTYAYGIQFNIWRNIIAFPVF